MQAQDASEECAEPASAARAGQPVGGTTAALTIGAVGVVFGDIGTSPLYAFREALAQAGAERIGSGEIIGVISLMIWALILVVTIKYILFLMRADNEGEGGVLALLALVRRGGGRGAGAALALGAVGAALFYGDAVITPALSVLSAAEGLRSIPGGEEIFTQPRVIAIALAVLIALFAVQARGTSAVSKLFGPICVVWFVTIGGLGIVHLGDQPGILAAFNPWHAARFLGSHGLVGLFVLGAVFLTVTGAEALTADMGHFGKLPIRFAWFALVFPALTLNYLGQGAFALATLEQAQAAGQAFANRDWFFLMAPEDMRLALVGIAGLATIIASQAVITGAYSLTHQAIQLGLLPRMRILQTSAGQAGQIYLPAINWLLLTGVVWMIYGFGTSSAMAAAYGIAVTGTMVVTCGLAYLVARRAWGWSRTVSVAVVLPFLALDLLFFGANILRVAEGGWAPLSIGAIVLVLIWTWTRGRRQLRDMEAEHAVPLAQMVTALERRLPPVVEGTAIYLAAEPDSTPHALLHNLKHNHVLHRHNIVATVRTLSRPWAEPGERFRLTMLGEHFAQLEARYGFMEQPRLRDDLIAEGQMVPGAQGASFFIGRSSLALAGRGRLPVWQKVIFAVMHRNAADPREYFTIPPNRVIELGAQFVI